MPTILSGVRRGGYTGGPFRWENEGGALPGAAAPIGFGWVAAAVGDSSLCVRLIALENTIIALLARAPES